MKFYCKVWGAWFWQQQAAWLNATEEENSTRSTSPRCQLKTELRFSVHPDGECFDKFQCIFFQKLTTQSWHDTPTTFMVSGKTRFLRKHQQMGLPWAMIMFSWHFVLISGQKSFKHHCWWPENHRFWIINSLFWNWWVCSVQGSPRQTRAKKYEATHNTPPPNSNTLSFLDLQHLLEGACLKRVELEMRI